MVEKNYWSTVRAPVPQEVQVYQHVEHTVNKGLHSDHVTRMLDFKIITSTAHIRRAFGIKSVAPKEHVRIVSEPDCQHFSQFGSLSTRDPNWEKC